ncbi:MAG: hypothetical protein NTV25_06315 [Methanothrix sp.]|nr:hypothetical protein [Methanothrix sp.]
MKMVLFMAALCLAALSLAGMSAAADSQATQGQTINSYQGNLSEKSFDFVSMTGLFGKLGFAVSEMTKFTAPKQGWKLKTISILAYDGYNGTVESLPSERIIALEVRDKDRNLLYRMSDSQLPYSNYAFNITEPYWLTIGLPSIPVSGEFYVCFYDRGAVAVACENLNKTNENSFFYNMAVDEQIPATLPLAKNQTAQVNWIMSLSGS